MEHGFYHPSRGYWQTISTPDADTLAAYPEGTIEVPLKPGPDYEWNGSEWVEVEPPPPPVPATVSAMQARIALANAGLLAAVESAVLGATQQTQIAWEYATEWQRESPTIAELAGIIGLTEAQIDDLFRAAAEITA